MSDLKAIGSEKLTGQDKIKRIMEIARYNETAPSSLNETSREEYTRSLADGNDYQIVKERQGYVIKKGLNESQEYIEPMKNRKYYSSYSQALKKLNLLAKELNRLNENEEGTSLFGEQKKFVLKTPKPKVEPDMEPTSGGTPPMAPPSVPSPELPQSPNAAHTDDMGPQDQSPELDVSVDAEVDTTAPEGEMGGIEPMDGETSDKDEMEEKVTFRTIQKLTGKLTQKIRTFDNQDGMTSEDIKYVINMILSSLDLANLSDEDKEDIMTKFEEAEGREENDDMGMEEPKMDDVTSDTEVEDIQADMDVPVEQEMEEGHGMILNNVFRESKVDKVLSKYFELSKKEILEEREKLAERKKDNKVRLEHKMKHVVEFTETIEQEIASKKFLEENSKFNLVGKTNKKNLVFENSEKQVKITPEGIVI